ncbi:MAG: hypothetical protein R2712_08665 [Vicinamibacterales bacterium]
MQTRVSLPPAAAGQSVRLRFQFATDQTVNSTGWSLDSVVVSSTACAAPAAGRALGTSPRSTATPCSSRGSRRWRAASPPMLEASADMGATYPYVFPVGAATSLSTTAPDGTHATRVRAVQGGATSAPSARVTVPVGSVIEPGVVRNAARRSGRRRPSRGAWTSWRFGGGGRTACRHGGDRRHRHDHPAAGHEHAVGGERLAGVDQPAGAARPSISQASSSAS